MVLPTRQEGMAINWRHKHYPTAASSEIDWSILLDAAPQEYYLTETISHSVMAIVATHMWKKIWGTRNTATTLVYRGKEMHECYLAAKVSSKLLQKVHIPIWKSIQLPYFKVNIAVKKMQGWLLLWDMCSDWT